MSSTSVLAGISLSLCLVLPTAAHADRVIDAFTSPLPDQTLPYSSTPGPYLWAGTLGEISQPLDIASQTNLSGVIGGARTTKVREATLSNFVYAALSGGTLTYATGLAPSGALTLEYGVTADLNMNVASDRAFSLYLDGDLNSGGSPRPVQLTITVKSGGVAAVSRTYTLLNDGQYKFRFSDFGSVNWGDVDYLKFHFDASQVQGVDYDLIGGLRTVSSL
ncbi:MAG TPA: hypothetical protein VNO30_48935 [Kofleriaceae bacterium]|nr:hypothetical protein [Kofleriaceae bacterium]